MNVRQLSQTDCTTEHPLVTTEVQVIDLNTFQILQKVMRSESTTPWKEFTSVYLHFDVSQLYLARYVVMWLCLPVGKCVAILWFVLLPRGTFLRCMKPDIFSAHTKSIVSTQIGPTSIFRYRVCRPTSSLRNVLWFARTKWCFKHTLLSFGFLADWTLLRTIYEWNEYSTSVDLTDWLFLESNDTEIED